MGEGVCKEREGIKVGRSKEGLQTRWDFVVSNEDEGDCCIKGKERVIEHPSPCSLRPSTMLWLVEIHPRVMPHVRR